MLDNRSCQSFFVSEMLFFLDFLILVSFDAIFSAFALKISFTSWETEESLKAFSATLNAYKNRMVYDIFIGLQY